MNKKYYNQNWIIKFIKLIRNKLNMKKLRDKKN